MPKSSRYSSFEDLRKKAEQQIEGRNIQSIDRGQPDSARVLYEIEVQRTELELQNEELQRALKELEASRNAYVDLYHGAPVGLVTIDDSGVIMQANEAFARMLPQRRWAIIGSSFYMLIEPQDANRFCDYLNQLAAAPPESAREPLELRLRTNSGLTIDTQVHIQFSYDEAEGGLRWRLALVDLTATGRAGDRMRLEAMTGRRHAEEALRQSEERFRALITAGSKIVYRMSADWKEMRQLQGRKFLTDIEKPNPDWFQGYIPTDEQPRVRSAIDEAIRTRRIFELEHRVVQADGSIGWTSSRAIPLFNDKGEIYEWFGAASDITERKHAEEELCESEAKYRSLFDSLDAGFCIIEVLFDDDGTPVDYVFLEANPAFVKQTGFVDAIGRRIRDLSPTHEEHWFEIYGEIVRTGKPLQFVASASMIGGWYEVYAFPIGEPGANRVAVLFSDKTAQIKAEDASKKSQERKAFLLKLSDALRPLVDPAEIQGAAARLLGEHLAANQVHYGETVGDAVIIHQGYGNGLPPMTGSFRHKEFGERLIAAYRSGKTTVCCNVATDPTITEKEAAVITGSGIRAYIAVPLVKDGEWVATLAVNGIAPREWTPAEAVLVEEVAERTWAAVEWAKAGEEKERLLSLVVEERERLRAIIGSIDDEVWISDTAGNMIQLNPAAQSANGLQTDGKRILEIVDSLEILEPDGIPRLPENTPLLRALKGETVRGEETIRHLNTGELRYRRFNCAPIRDRRGNVTGTVSVCQDITEAKRAEQELKQSETRRIEAITTERQRLYDLLERLPAMICLINPDYQIVFANQAFREKFGEAHGRHCYEYCMGESDKPCAFCESFKVLETGNPHHWEAITPDGSVIDVYGHPFTDVDGSPLILEMDLDITERKRTEEALRRLNETLERQVAERTDLAEARAKQLQALAVELIETEERERRNFAHLLHDDLQQMLAAARMQIEAASEALPDGNMLSNVAELLNESIAKSRRLSQDLSPAILHQAGLIASLRWLATQMMKQFGLKVDLELNTELLLERTPQKVFLFRAVQELLFNTVKHAGIKSATVEVTSSDDSITVSVSDRGSGFDPEILDNGHSDRGFGLLTIKERASYIGGAFTIESAADRGSRFKLTVPNATAYDDEVDEVESFDEAAVEEPPRAKRRAAASRADGTRVLFVDDHQVMRQGLIKLVKGQSALHVVGEAANGREALEQVRRLKPDVIVMDISMPEMDGIEATRRIKAEQSGVRIIGLTMHDDEQLTGAMLQAGAEATLSKATSAAELLKAIYGLKSG